MVEKSWKYPNCVDDTTFEGDCTCGYQMRSSTSCCDNIELYAAETTEDGQLSGKFNVFAKQNTTDCAGRVSLRAVSGLG